MLYVLSMNRLFVNGQETNFQSGCNTIFHISWLFSPSENIKYSVVWGLTGWFPAFFI